MSHDLTVSFSEPTWQLLNQQAAVTGTPPQTIVENAVQEHLARRVRRKPKSEMTEEEKEEARRRFRSHFGTISMGTGADNESIDRDLAREYGDNHEPT
jgi:hypothetical protein